MSREGVGEPLFEEAGRGFADDFVGCDKGRHAAEAVRTHLRAGEGRFDADMRERFRAAHDVLQDEVVAVDAEIEIEGLRIGGGLGQLFGDAIMKPGRCAVRLSSRVAQGGDRQRRAIIDAVAAEKVHGVAGNLVFEERVQYEPFERRHIGKRDIGLNDG